VDFYASKLWDPSVSRASRKWFEGSSIVFSATRTRAVLPEVRKETVTSYFSSALFTLPIALLDDVPRDRPRDSGEEGHNLIYFGILRSRNRSSFPSMCFLVLPHLSHPEPRGAST
jgi:hypothetical protein